MKFEFVAKHRLPTMCAYKEFVVEGGLMSYGPSYTDSFRRSATYVDKVLKGTKPSDLPVEQPMRFELIINRKTAKTLGLPIPPELLLLAYDRAIGEGIARGRQSVPTVAEDAPVSQAITLNEVVSAFWNHAESYYRREDGTPSPHLVHFRLALKILVRLYGPTPAEKFGPLALRARALVTSALSDF